MKLSKHVFAITVTLLITYLPLGIAAQPRDYVLATASTGGTYYPVGVALATLVKIKLQPGTGIGLSAISSAGSGENIKLLRENEAQFAILQGLYGYYAKTGAGPLEQSGPQTYLRSITALWPNVEHFVIDSSLAPTGTIADLSAMKGKTLAMGKKNSGTLGSNTLLLKNLGVDIAQDFDLIYVGYSGAADAVANRKADGMSTPGGAPVSAVSQVFANRGDSLSLLNFSEQQAIAADNGMQLWSRYLIPGGTYPGLNQDTHTIAQPNFLAVRADASDEDVYLITKTIFENLMFLSGIHKATADMKPGNALEGLPVPLHPGAIRYFEEAGITVPARLK